MCIILLKPKKKNMPSMAMMDACFENNPHGAGFMYRTDDHQIHIRKGFMTLAELVAALDEVNAHTPFKRRDVCIHFRISTTGSTIPQNTHPFPLSNHVKDLKQLDIVCDRAIAHNGILREYATFHNKKSDMSDTMYFAKMLQGVNERFVGALLNHHSSGSRFVYMSGTKTIHVGMTRLVSGDGKGLLVSNDTWMERETVVWGGLSQHWGSVYSTFEDEEKWEKWDNRKSNGVSRVQNMQNPVYARWVRDKNVRMTFDQYCNHLDDNIQHAIDSAAKKPDPSPHVAGMFDDIWEEVPTAQTRYMFGCWMEDIGTYGVSAIASPVSRIESSLNPAYMFWMNSVQVHQSFHDFCTTLEDELKDLAKEYYAESAGESVSAPVADVDVKHKQEREQRYAERAAFTEYLERGC
jgi:predicted glutamine amidotransferase